MNIFDFSTGTKEKKIIDMVEQMKGILISYFGEKRANSICSILDDTNFIIAPKAILSDPTVIKKYTTNELEKLGIEYSNGNLKKIDDFLIDYDLDALRFLLSTTDSQETILDVYKDKDCNIDRIYDDFGSLFKINFINYAAKETPDLFYSDPKLLNTFATNEFVSQYWGTRDLENKDTLAIKKALKDKAPDTISQILNIDFLESSKAVEDYTCLANDLDILVAQMRRSLNKLFNENPLKEYINRQLKDNDHIPKEGINNAVYLFKDFIFINENDSKALVYAVDNYDSLESRIFCSLKVDNTLSTLIHESIHLVSTRLTHDPLGIYDGHVSKTGFCTLSSEGEDLGWAFSEFFTQYLTLDILNKQFPNELKNSNSIYNPLVALYKDFFDKFYEPLLDSFFGWNYNSIISLFGKQNLIDAFKAADQLYDIAETLPDKKVNNTHVLLDSKTDPSTKTKIQSLLTDKESQRYIKAAKKVKTLLDAMCEHAEQCKNI